MSEFRPPSVETHSACRRSVRRWASLSSTNQCCTPTCVTTTRQNAQCWQEWGWTTTHWSTWRGNTSFRTHPSGTRIPIWSSSLGRGSICLSPSTQGALCRWVQYRGGRHVAGKGWFGHDFDSWSKYVYIFGIAQREKWNTLLNLLNFLYFHM